MNTRNNWFEKRQKKLNQKYGRPEWWPVRLPPGINVYPKNYVNLTYGGGPLLTGIEMAEDYKIDERVREIVRRKLIKRKLYKKKIIKDIY